jgi:hypothetical protein
MSYYSADFPSLDLLRLSFDQARLPDGVGEIQSLPDQEKAHERVPHHLEGHVWFDEVRVDHGTLSYLGSSSWLPVTENRLPIWD